MLFIANNLIGESLKAEKKYKLEEFINTKRFTVIDTGLTYRQANDLDENKLLDPNRQDKTSWRKFSFKELVYIDVVLTLKSFGLKSEQLKPLWESFFKKPQTNNVDMFNKTHGETAMCCVFAGIEITILTDSKGNIHFVDPVFRLRMLNPEPQITISLNKSVNKLIEKAGKEPVPVQYTVNTLLVNNKKQ